MEYDVHFSLNGYYRITANSEEEAEEIVYKQLEAIMPQLENEIVHTGLGIEVYDVLESEEQYGEEE